MRSTALIDHQVAAEIAQRVACRLAILAEDRPDLLAERLARWDAEGVRELLALTRLPERLADREPPRPHRGVCGVDHCTEALVSGAGAGEQGPRQSLEYVDADLPQLDDEDLLAARHYVPETLPGNVLG